MGRKYVIRDQNGLYFVTFTVVNWVDVFIRDEYREIIIESLRFCQKNKGLKVYAYCIMTSHVHLIISSKEGFNLSETIRDFKSFTSGKLKRCIMENGRESRRKWLMEMFRHAGEQNKRNTGFQLWQQDNHPIELDINEMMEQRLNYIHNNPVVAGFVNDPNSWVWSSCADYEKGLKGKLDIIYIE